MAAHSGVFAQQKDGHWSLALDANRPFVQNAVTLGNHTLSPSASPQDTMADYPQEQFDQKSPQFAESPLQLTPAYSDAGGSYCPGTETQLQPAFDTDNSNSNGILVTRRTTLPHSVCHTAAAISSVPSRMVNFTMVPLKRNGRGYLLEDGHVFIKSNERNGTFYLKCLAWRNCGARAKVDSNGVAKVTTGHNGHSPPDVQRVATRPVVKTQESMEKPRCLEEGQAPPVTPVPCVQPDVRTDTPDIPGTCPGDTASPSTHWLPDYHPTWPIVPLGQRIERISRRLMFMAEMERIAREVIAFNSMEHEHD